MTPPLDGPIFPGGEPEPTEAEFRADYAALMKMLKPIYGPGGQVPEFDEADPLATLRRAELIETFVQRHRRRLEAKNMPTQQFLDDAARLRAFTLERHAQWQKATEDFLQAGADLADAEPKVIEALLSAAVQMRKILPDAEDAVRERFEPLLEKIETHREEWLSRLPLEERRRLEAEGL